jgi:hypothetical protein
LAVHLPHAMRNLLSHLLAVGPELAAYILTAPLLASTAYALTPVAAPSPNLDLSDLGRVAVAGDFDSISLFSYYGQTENVLNTNGSQSLLTRYPDGSWDSLGLSDAYVESMCSFVRNGNLQGVVLGGNFTSVEGVEAKSVALWDADSGSISPLSGINGKVNALYCDNESGTVYVGGMFQAGNSTNAIAWTTGWTNLPFTGFNGEVISITKNDAGNIVFGGSFTGLGSVSDTNNTSPIKTDAQVVNLAGGKIGATGTTTTAGFDNPRNIICKTGEDGPGNTWLLADNTGGWWQGLFSFGFNPTKLRLYNTKWQGRGTKSFYFENLDTGAVLNLNYIDVNGNNRSCSNPCPLPQDNSTYQDFYMVPSVGMGQFRIFITEWYGDGGGLAGIEMFQEDLYSFAVQDFNEPKCDGVSSGSSSTVTPSSGFWHRKPNLGQTSSDYLSATLTSESQLDDNPSVVFTPDIQQSGNYSILVYTPGCLLDDTCATRGTVAFTGTMTSEGAPSTTTITQTNDYDKFDQVYYGFVDVDSASFSPSVTLTPIAGQPLPQTIVAQRVRFDLVDSTGGLNGLYEYNPNKANVNTDFSSSPINAAATKLDSGAVINSVVSYEDRIYVAGKFGGNGMNNVMSISDSAKSLGKGGLNADVNAMYLDGSSLYMGGNFTNTQDNSGKGLNNVCAYNTDNEDWTALGAGVDGVVWTIVPLTLNVTAGKEETCITVNGDFLNVNAFDGNDAFATPGFAVWVPSKQNWLNNLPNADVRITGKLITQTSVPGMEFPLYAGQITSQDLAISGIAELFGSGSPFLSSLAIKIKPSSTSSSSSSKRAIDPSDISDGVYTGHFYEDDNKNVTILGGHFSATASDGSTVQNLVFISGEGGTVTGASELDSDSTIAAMDVHDNFLFAGGSLSGTVDGNDLNGLIVYNLDNLKIASPQPPALAGDNVIVNAVATQPDGTAVYVGGSFDTAGSLPCSTLCMYDTSTQQWNSAVLDLSGNITSMMWTSKTVLVISGDLTHAGKHTTMATYDAKKQVFAPFTKASGLPGSITCLTPGSSSFSEWWAAGISSSDNTAWLSKFQDDKWHSVGGLGQGTSIRGIQVLSLTDSHDDTDLVSGDEILMIVGNINVPSFGNASAVLYNGTAFAPFILTSKDDGSQGTLASIFVSNPQGLLNMGGGALAVGFVVLIGLAIALALIFLIVVAGILMERQRRRREGYVPMKMDRNGNMQRIPPEMLLGNLQGAKGDAPKV